MDGLLKTIGDQVAAIFSNPIVVLALRAVTAYLGVLWIAVAYWAYRDMRARSHDVVSPYLAAAGVILFTPLFFPLAVVAYRIVRPPETIAERDERVLHETLLAEQTARPTCPFCRELVDPDWVRCPACRTQLATLCPSCGNRIGLDWSACAWCAHDF